MQVSMNARLLLTVDYSPEIANEPLIKRALTHWAEDGDGQDPEVVEIEVPSTLQLCGKCDGRGSHSLRFGAFSGDALAEAREDEEFWEGYTSGAFDEGCDRCEGTGRVKVPAENLPKWLAEAIQSNDQAESDYAAEHHAEMRAQYGSEYGREFGDY